MRGSRYTFKSEDYRDISAVKWIPDDDIEVIGAVQIFHGRAEHIERMRILPCFSTGRDLLLSAMITGGIGNPWKQMVTQVFFRKKRAGKRHCRI